MNHNLYRSLNYIIHRRNKESGVNEYFSSFFMRASEALPTFETNRKRAIRIQRFYKLLNHLVLFYHLHLAGKLDDFWDLNIDCCFSNGAFVTAKITELLEKDGFHKLYLMLKEKDLIHGVKEFSTYLFDKRITNSDIVKAIFQSLLDNRIYRNYDYLFLFPEQNKSSDYHYQESKRLGAEIQRLKIRSEAYRGFLFKNKEDINLCLLNIDFGKDKRMIYLPEYSSCVFNALAKDKNYKDKISSIV